jgi:integrase
MPLKLYRRKGSDIWHYRGTVAGKRLRGSTRTSDKDRALRIAAEKDARQWTSHLDGPAAVLTFANAAALYMKAGKQTRFLRKLIKHWNNTPVKEITAGAIRQSAVTLYPDVSGATRNRTVITPTQAIINHAAESELCQRIRVKRFPIEKKMKEPASWTWVRAFMSASSPHLGALACFMFATGARITEALSLTWMDVDFSSSTALIRQTKIGAQRRAHLPPALVAAMANIAGRGTRLGGEGKVFRYRSRNSAAGPWRAAIKRAGIKPLSFHACRHGFATAALRAGIDIITVTKLGGWKTPQHVFGTYGHASDDATLTDRLIGNDADLTQGNFQKSRNVGKSKA